MLYRIELKFFPSKICIYGIIIFAIDTILYILIMFILYVAHTKKPTKTKFTLSIFYKNHIA